MRRMLRWLAAASIGVVVFCTEIGCSDPFEAVHNAEADSPVVDSPFPGKDVAHEPDPGVYRLSPASVPSVIEPGAASLPNFRDFNQPNGIWFETCTFDPDEIAVPFELWDKPRFCDTLTATAFHVFGDFSYPVPAVYTFKIADESIARPSSGSFTFAQNQFRPVAQYDILSQDGLTDEPTTNATVCVEPPGGWSDPTHPPICRELRLRTVVNLNGVWCFSGTTFPEDQCEEIEFRQDGRTIHMGDYGYGVIYENQFDAEYDLFEYRTIELTRTTMKGLVIAEGYPYGMFEAYRLPQQIH